jgi:hypothetical protein
MNSLMSMRTIALSSSNRKPASALVSSVLPTPVGPRNRKLPSGRFGSCSPAGAAHRLGHGHDRIRWPITRGLLFHLEQLLALALQHRSTGTPVQRLTTAAMSSAVTSSRSMALAAGLRLGQLLFQLGDAAIGQLARLGEIALALRLFQLDARGVQRFLDLALGGDLVALVLPAGGQSALCSVGQFLAQGGQPVLTPDRFPWPAPFPRS